jgi:hypothetical protein
MKTIHALHEGVLQEGISPPVGFEDEATKGKIFLVNVYCNLIVNLDRSL